MGRKKKEKVEKICEECGEGFVTKKGKQRFCCILCKTKNQRIYEEKIEKVCEWCKKVFVQNRRGQRFCCISCSNIRTNSKREKRVFSEKNCEECGEKFACKQKETQRFCCVACRAKNGRMIGEKVCEWCGKVYMQKCKKQKFCDRNCSANSMRIIREKICEYCGEIFICKEKAQKFCCPECASENNKKNKKKDCEWCGKSFLYKRESRKFCSKICYGNSVKVNRGKMCEVCGVVFDGRRNQRFCSLGCFSVWTTGKKRVFRERECDECGKIFSGGKRQRFCCKPCAAKNPEVRKKISITTSQNIVNGTNNNGKNRYKKGYIFSIKMSKEMYYDSSWEENIIKYLDKAEDVSSFEKEPFYIPYFFSGSRNYNPDFLINYEDGTEKLVEIKPDKRIKEPQNIAKFQSAKIYCDMHELEFEVWTEKNTPFLKGGTCE